MGPLKTLVSETQKLIKIASQSSSFVKDDLCRHVYGLYVDLQKQERQYYLKELAKQHNYSSLSLSVLNVRDSTSNALRIRQLHQIKENLVPPYRGFFLSLGRIPDGVKFLVDLRTDILEYQAQLSTTSASKPTFTDDETLAVSENLESFRPDDVQISSEIVQILPEDISSLQVLSVELKDLLSVWFAAGLFQLQRVTWDSPCSMLQKVSDIEAVHRMRSWADLKRRVGPYRRCYVFTHPCMPSEPVVVLHTALCPGVETSMRAIVSRQPLWNTPMWSDPGSSSKAAESVEEVPANIGAAVFYSISSPHRGLAGIELGNTLIKRVVRELQGEFPHLNVFTSLSPIPGFRKWLNGELNRHLHKEVESRIVSGGRSDASSPLPLLPPEELALIYKYFRVTTLKDAVTQLRLLLDTPNATWAKETQSTTDQIDTESQGMLSRILSKLCARYIYLEKHRGYALDPVANFHLRNGAVLWQVNWLADTTARGMSLSYGLMINYRYFLDQTERNSRNYLENKEIAISQDVANLLEGMLEPRIHTNTFSGEIAEQEFPAQL